MKKENERKGLFSQLAGNKAGKKSACCCNFEIEEISEDKPDKDGVKTDSGCCCAGSDCCGAPAGKVEKKQIVIDYLYLDLSVCDRCQGAEDSLHEALKEVAKVLEATGTEVTVNKIHVDAREKAVAHKFLCSPTIRINGRDIQLDYKESLCESCGDLCGDKVDCRVWLYQGKEYTVPPKAMIIEAILKAVYGGLSEDIAEKEYEIPDNLAYFYTVMEAKKNRS